MKRGLYVHIPFCQSKCHYCDFLSFSQNHDMEAYSQGLQKEIISYGKLYDGLHTIASIFIGGGTPTALPPFLLEKVCETIVNVFELEEDVEWTIEANPGTLTKGHIEVIKKFPINRISLGLQSCESHLLRRMGRIHTKKDWEETVEALQSAGITNINTDLMFGLPNQTLEDLKQTLEEVTKKDIKHLSVYTLIVEEGTPFYSAYEKGQLALPSEEEERKMYTYIKNYLKQKGYTQYEVSNWAKEGYACKHNCSYWTLDEYIGVGLGAHSFVEGIRYENTSEMATYIEAHGNLQKIISDKQPLSEKNRMEEFMFLGLRMTKGINVNVFKRKFGQDLFEIYGDVVTRWIKEKLLVHDKDNIFFTEQGIEVSNQILATFLLD